MDLEDVIDTTPDWDELSLPSEFVHHWITIEENDTTRSDLAERIWLKELVQRLKEYVCQFEEENTTADDSVPSPQIQLWEEDPKEPLW